MLATQSDGSERAIEVKGRAASGEVLLSENEWAQACNLRGRYWLYIVYDCASAQPRLLRIPDPFGNLLVHTMGARVTQEQILQAAQMD